MPDVWRVELLGGLRAARGDRVVTRFETRKAAALLAYLALYPQRSHSRESLAEQLWPDEDPDATRNRFKQVLSLLRRELEPSGTEPGSVLLTDRTHVRVQPGALVSDVAEFEAALAESRSRDGAQRIAALERAAELYQGELLPGAYEEVLLSERQRLFDAYLDTLETLARLLGEAGELSRAVEYARRALSADPLREPAHLTLMQLYAASGRASDALRQFSELERLLRENLDATPSAAARAIAEQVRQQELPARPTPLLAMAASVTQTAVPIPHAPTAEPAASPEPPAAPPAPRLPAPLTRLFGRDPELSRLSRLLSPGGGARLVTLIGPAGAGKSRLGIEAARALQEGLQGRAWFVPLAAKREMGAVTAAIAAALGLPVSEELDPLERILGFLSGRGVEAEAPPALLVLDNFEHLLSGPESQAATRLILDLLERAPSLRCLVTSRQRLEIEGERVFPVLPLSTPAAHPAVEQVAAYPSVALFVDRAEAADPDFELTSENAPAVAELCARLEGLPLALELAAAWAAELSPSQMLRRLESRFELLVSRRRDLDDRHQSLHAALEWSCQQLDPVLKRFYAGLSAFRGGFTLEAAEAVASGFVRSRFGESPGALQHLGELRSRSLLVAEASGEAMRYRFLETLREHAASQLTANEEPALGRLHALYYLNLAETAERKLDGPDQAQWLAAVKADHDNLRAALAWCEAHGEAVLLARLAGAMVEFWERHGYFQEGRTWLERGLACQDELSASERALILRGDGVLRWYQHDHSGARAALQEALACYEVAPDARGLAITLTRLAGVALAESQFDEAEAHYRRALQLYREQGDPTKSAWVLRSLGEVAAFRKDFPAAFQLFEESLEICRDLGELRGIAGSLTYIGGVARAQGNLELSRSTTEEALRIHEELGDRPARASALDCLACLAAADGDWEAAYRLGGEAVRLHRELGQPLAVSRLLGELGRTLAEVGRMQRATLLWGAAVRTDTLHPQETQERLLGSSEADFTRMMLGDEDFAAALKQGKQLAAERALSVVFRGDGI